jgi:hypothetical protein
VERGPQPSLSELGAGMASSGPQEAAITLKALDSGLYCQLRRKDSHVAMRWGLRGTHRAEMAAAIGFPLLAVFGYLLFSVL